MKIKRILLAVMALIMSFMASAQTVEIDGIRYYLNGNTAEVSRQPEYIFPENMLGDVSIPNILSYQGRDYTVTSICDNAFWMCSLTSVSIPNSVKHIGEFAFGHCAHFDLYIQDWASWFDISFDIDVPLRGGLCEDEPESSNPQYRAARIFVGGEEVKDVVIPNGVTSIKSFTFCGGLLSTITIPQSVTHIETAGFEYIANLTDVYCYSEKAYSVSVPDIRDYDGYPVEVDNYQYVFENCRLDNVTLHVPEDVLDEYKTSGPWSNFKKIVAIEDPDAVKFTLTYLVDGEEYKTFKYKEGRKITPEEEPSKQGYTFSGWKGLPDTMPAEDVTVTGTFAINEYTITYMVDGEVYKSYDIDYNLAIVPEAEPEKDGFTFSGWSEIPATMPAEDVIVYGTFSNTEKIVDGVKYKIIDGEAVITELVSGRDVIIVPSIEDKGKEYAVRSVPKGIFSESDITSVVISNGIKTIGQEAFKGCRNLKTISLGSTITRIEERAFSDLDNLDQVICKASELPDIHRTAFENSYIDYVALYVPDESVDEYKATNPWRGFKSITGISFKTYTLTYIVDGEVYKTQTYEEGDIITPEPAPAKEGYVFSGWDNLPKVMPGEDITVNGTFTEIPPEKCSAPTIAVVQGEVVFACETEGVVFHYDIKSLDEKTGEGNSVRVTNTYRVMVYASKDGYDDSETVTADICIQEKDGDTNGDGTVNAADIVTVVNMIMSSKE